MSRAVAAVNERDVTENEGEILFIRKAKEAEANWVFIKIRVFRKLKGQGLSDFRQKVAKGHIAVEGLQQASVNHNPSSPQEIMEEMSAFYRGHDYVISHS